MSEIQEVLQATSNVIELKPEKKYLLVFQPGHFSQGQMRHIQDTLKAHGIVGTCLFLPDGETLDVIEVPKEE